MAEGLGLPGWVKELRPGQVRAVAEVMEAFGRGADVVLLNGPTGSGKTVIAEVVRRKMGVRKGSYIAHSLSLQDQFLRDFDYARVLKGRGNYPTLFRPDLTAADCGKDRCRWCDPKSECPYMVARREAMRSEVAVLNTSYFLTFPGPAFVRDLVVLDEADTLESIMLSHYEFEITRHKLMTLGVVAPVKGARVKTLVAWLDEELLPGLRAEYREWLTQLNEWGMTDERAMRKLNAAKGLVERAEMVREQLAEGRPWVREYSGSGFLMRPVEVSRQGAEVLWNRGKRKAGWSKWLAMSATFVDGSEWVESTGVVEAGLNWEWVDVPNMWDKANRPIVTKTFGDMGRAGTDEEKARVIQRAVEICEEHKGLNVLVHSVSYGLALEISNRLRDVGIDAISYTRAKDREAALERFRAKGGVIVAPSLDRGVDLPGDLCRVQIVVKMPYLYLGDRQVSERLRMDNGELWYQVQAARALVQMTGRGVRYEDDWCVTYVLDSAFDRFYRKWSRLLPRWWRDSIVGEWNGREVEN